MSTPREQYLAIIGFSALRRAEEQLAALEALPTHAERVAALARVMLSYEEPWPPTEAALANQYLRIQQTGGF